MPSTFQKHWCSSAKYGLDGAELKEPQKANTRLAVIERQAQGLTGAGIANRTPFMASSDWKCENSLLGLLPQGKTSSFLARASPKEAGSPNKEKEGQCCNSLGPYLNFGMNFQNQEKLFCPHLMFRVRTAFDCGCGSHNIFSLLLLLGINKEMLQKR